MKFVALKGSMLAEADGGNSPRKKALGKKSSVRDKISFSQPADGPEFTGERYVSSIGGPIQYEHYHRYIFAANYCEGKEVLDIASGEGYGSAFLAGVAASVVGVDVDPAAIALASSSFQAPNLAYRLGSCTDIPLPAAAVDVIVSFETLEHFTEHEAFLSECKRVLRPGGVMIISTPDKTEYSPPGTPPNPYHLRELTLDEFDALLSRYFDNYTLLGQSPIMGSVIAPLDAPKGKTAFLNETELRTYEESSESKAPIYLIAVIGADAPENLQLLNGDLSGRPAFEAISTKASVMEGEVVRLQTELARAGEEIERLGAAAAQLSTDLALAYDNGGALSRDKDALAGEVARLSEAQDALRAEAVRQEQAVRTRDARITVLSASVEATEAALGKELRHSVEQALQATGEAVRLRIQFEAATAQLAQEIKERTHLELRLAAASTDLAKAATDLATVHGLAREAELSAEELRERLRGEAAARQALQSEIGALREKQVESEAGLAELSSEVGELRTYVSDLESDRANDKWHISELNRTLGALGEEVEYLEGKRAEGGTQVHSLQEQICYLEQKRAEGGAHVAALQRSIAIMADEISHQQAMLHELRSSTSWIVARGFIRLVSFTPSPVRRLGRSLLIELSRLSQRARGITPPPRLPAEVKASPARSETALSATAAIASSRSDEVLDPVTWAAQASKATIIIALAPHAALSDTAAAAFSAASAAGVEVILCSPAMAIEGVIRAPAPPGADITGHVDQLIRASSSPVVLLVVQDIALEPSALAEAALAIDAAPGVVAMNGVATPLDEQLLPPSNFRGRTVCSIEQLIPSLVAFDADAYRLLGGLAPDAGGLAGALAAFSRRAIANGFDVAFNPFLRGRVASAAGGATLPVARDNARPQALFCDLVTPTWNRDCGSLNLYWNIKIFQELGYECTFMATQARGHEGRYTDDLRRMGVHVVLGEDYDEPWKFLAAEGHRFDVALLFRVGCACHTVDSIRQFAPQAKIIFVTVDLHFLRESRAAELAQSQALVEQADATKREELRVMRIADVTTIVSTYEMELLATLAPDVPARWIPIVSPIAGLIAPAARRKGVMFVGGFGHHPNLDAVIYFIGEIWPLVRELAPDGELYIIGSSPTPEVMATASETDGVHIVGFVENLGPWYQQMQVNIAPLRYGGGIKGKIISSLSVGLPTVATSMAVEGMGLQDGIDVMIADTPQEFARKVAELCSSEHVWNEMSRQSVATARRLYSVEAVTKNFQNALRDLRLPIS